MRKVVVNTTPLIALSHVGQLFILKELYGEIIIPEAVYRELSVKAESICKRTVDRSLGHLIGFGWRTYRIKWQNLCIRRNSMKEKSR